jgi:hypothetical protein
MHTAARTVATSLATVAVMLATTTASDGRQRTKATIADVGWMAGTWVSTSGPRRVEERWTPPAGGSMLAVSRTLNGDRLVEFEYLRVVERDGGLIYIAQPNGQPPTEFPMTRLQGRHARFENPQHDFPKTIEYEARPDGSLVASISGADGQRKMTWTFIRESGG